MKKDKRSVLVLLSGGLDSSTLLHDLFSKYERVEALSFNYGSNHNVQELKCAKWQCEKLGVKHHIHELHIYDEFKSSSTLLSGGKSISDGKYTPENIKKTVVPFRNGVLLSIAIATAGCANIDLVAIANHFQDDAVYPDCRAQFIQSMRQTALMGTEGQVDILAPYTKLLKKDIVTIGKALGVDYDHTYSCYVGGEKQCGKCSTCIDRIQALKEG